MNLKDFFKRNKVEDTRNQQIRELSETNEFLQETIEKIKYIYSNELGKLNDELDKAKRTKTYKTGKTLENIQTTLNNSQTNSWTFSGTYNNIEIKNGKVYIDGKEQKDITNCANKNIYIKLEKPCDIDITNTDSITIYGDVADVDITNGTIYCNDVKGDIDITNGNVYRR